MTKVGSNHQLLISRIPVLGILLFAILFLYSSCLYPGGSQADIHSVGFDWINNYWCNLMNEKGMNGEPNPARKWAILAMFLLCMALGVFFWQFSEFLTSSKFWKRSIKIGGILSMLFAVFMFTEYHDLVTVLSSLCGLVAVVGVIKEIYYSHMHLYKLTGFVCLLLLALNNVIYYSQAYIEWLPLLQKVTFAVVLLWVLGVNRVISKRIKLLIHE